MTSNRVPIPHRLLDQWSNLFSTRLALMRPNGSSREKNLTIRSVPDFQLEEGRGFEGDFDGVEEGIGGAFVESLSESVCDDEGDFWDFDRSVLRAIG